MDKRIFFTLNEYKSNYDKLLSEFLDQYIDNDEAEFLKREIELYKVCLRNTKIVDLYSSGLPILDVETSLLGVDIIWEIDKEIRNNNGLDIERTKQLNLSFSKILNFLMKNNVSTKSPNSFSDYFIENKYQEAIDSLINEKLIEELNKDFKYRLIPRKELTDINNAIALFVVLEKEGYLKSNIKSKERIIDRFFGIEMNKATFSRMNKSFSDDYDIPEKQKEKFTNYHYLQPFKKALSSV